MSYYIDLKRTSLAFFNRQEETVIKDPKSGSFLTCMKAQGLTHMPLIILTVGLRNVGIEWLIRRTTHG